MPKPAATRPMAAAPVQAQPRGGRWWIAPAVVVGLVLVAWLVLAGLPFGREEAKPRAAAPATETIAEAPDPPQSATLIEVPPGEADDSFEIATTTTQEPPMVAPAPNTTTVPPPTTATTPPPATTTTRPAPPVQRTPVQRPPAQRPPVVVQQPRPQPQQPAPVRVVPRPDRTGEISGEEAEATLRDYVRSTRYYEVASECVRVENRGYRNVGYNLEVWHSCPGGGGASRLLGRWRVDSKTREVFRQREDGRYLRP